MSPYLCSVMACYDFTIDPGPVLHLCGLNGTLAWSLTCRGRMEAEIWRGFVTLSSCAIPGALFIAVLNKNLLTVCMAFDHPIYVERTIYFEHLVSLVQPICFDYTLHADYHITKTLNVLGLVFYLYG